jgi:hypothetical protein
MKAWRWYAVAAVALVVLALCGRRKMVYMVPMFFLATAAIYWVAARRGRWMARIVLMALPVMVVSSTGGGLAEDADQVRYYTQGSAETFDSLETHGIDSVVETYRQAGFFGSGLGFATPGSQHIPGARPRVWQESGPSRVMVELGVPGLSGLVFLVLVLLRAGWRVCRSQLRARSPAAPYAVGFLAFFLSNIGSLVVSGQILADSFIAAMIGLSIGVTLSAERLVPTRFVAVPHPSTATARQLPVGGYR